MGNKTALPDLRLTPPLTILKIGLACCLFGASPAYSADKQMQTRAFWKDVCPSDATKGKDEQLRSGAVAAIAMALAPKIIEGAVDAAAGALKAAGETKSTSTTARISTDFYKTNDQADLLVVPNCLIVVRGDYSALDSEQHNLAKAHTEFSGLKSVSFYLEARVKRLRGLKYFEIVPNKLEVKKFDHWRVFGSSKRDYNVALTLTVPGSTTPFGSAQLNFPGVTRPLTAEGQVWRLTSATSLPIQFPPESADSSKVRERLESKNAPFLLALDILNPVIQGPGEPVSVYTDAGVKSAAKTYCDSLAAANKLREKDRRKFDDRCDYSLDANRKTLDKAEVAASRNYNRKVWAHSVCEYVPEKTSTDGETIPSKCENMPSDPDIDGMSFTRFTTEVVLTESSEGSKFALFLGSALSASKEEVSGVIKGYLPRPEEVRDAENDAEAAAREETVVADLGVELAQTMLAETQLPAEPDKVKVASARIALVKAKITANDAHRKAGTAIPFPNLSNL